MNTLPMPAADIDQDAKLASSDLQGHADQSHGITHRNTATVTKHMRIDKTNANFLDVDMGFLKSTSSCLFILLFLAFDISFETILLAGETEKKKKKIN